MTSPTARSDSRPSRPAEPLYLTESDVSVGKKILYIDMDNTLVDFTARLNGVDQALREKYRGREDELPGLFALMPPMAGAVERPTVNWPKCSTPTYCPPHRGATRRPGSTRSSGYKVHLGIDPDSPAYKRLILTHHKNLNRGDYLVDDRPVHNGADRFEGEVIHFGAEGSHKTWPEVVSYLRERG